MVLQSFHYKYCYSLCFLFGQHPFQQQVSGSTIGIVGLGNIGRAVAERAKGFKMNILYHSRTRREELEKYLGKSR